MWEIIQSYFAVSDCFDLPILFILVCKIIIIIIAIIILIIVVIVDIVIIFCDYYYD